MWKSFIHTFFCLFPIVYMNSTLATPFYSFSIWSNSDKVNGVRCSKSLRSVRTRNMRISVWHSTAKLVRCSLANTFAFTYFPRCQFELNNRHAICFWVFLRQHIDFATVELGILNLKDITKASCVFEREREALCLCEHVFCLLSCSFYSFSAFKSNLNVCMLVGVSE